ncbi:MAG: T9SS C-terminal target domain-containing protein [Bacteroidetes bacterium]|nr:MAG: T9SS C-terminal target domain-containing protein [Bacteroidota bacterium]REK06567.1 MAG: T9SS C-terminal target domain-containing protein [Bacteroidota bacterium]REK33333.1 MAG: T9SS C-terminal target domain-containing protein [Bacteroidota bacterium]REK49733.1 MAG: T9SS C-terminal target domain-containing protein [Bacteroidota bacterium]
MISIQLFRNFRRILIFILSLFPTVVSCQVHSLIWPLCDYLGNPPNMKMNMNFSSGNLVIDTVYRPSGFVLTNSAISDSTGQLLFYTNGCFIANALNDTMPDGDGMSTTPCGDQNCGYGTNIVLQSTLAIPDPGNLSQYYIFHETCEHSTQLHPWNLLYSKVDLSLQGGLGAVTHKNTDILSQVLDGGILTGTRHGNGRDWWVMVHGHNTDEYIRFLVTPEGVQGPFRQNIGPIIWNDARGNSKFSPDGTLFATSTFQADVRLFNFDRCTGLLSNMRYYDTHDSIFIACLEFSASSRFLYLSAQPALMQFDLLNSPSTLVPTIIDRVDGFLAPDTCYFFVPQLAPDNKIYISSWSGSYAMHTIGSPDSAGQACQFVQHSILLPCINSGTVPNLINYKLGALPGSSCDSLTTDITEVIKNKTGFTISPNPISNQINIHKLYELVNEKTYHISILNSQGQVLFEKTLFQNESSIPANFLKAGVYVLQIKTSKGVFSERFVKLD